VQGNVLPDGQVLLAKVGAIACAIPIARVIETMRPLPIEPVGDGPGFVRGVAIIRGVPTIVVDTARLLGVADGGAPTRFVTVRAGERALALTFDAVVAVRHLDAAVLGELPPLLQLVARDAVAAIATLDKGVLVVLETARAISEAQWTALERRP